MSLRLRFFAHSWRSDWNHGNAHFLRGLVDELARLGHEVRCYEADNAWSYVNLPTYAHILRTAFSSSRKPNCATRMSWSYTNGLRLKLRTKSCRSSSV
ncbi:MAG: hypothetical protein DMG94_07380 [Acidobacteria bacterium]|nr:MAG: hypothetical protein DMG94_07380 [Acidobacteriota bacterium]